MSADNNVVNTSMTILCVDDELNILNILEIYAVQIKSSIIVGSKWYEGFRNYAAI
tara:strand:+ start:330 stop:494 length:165 start_codon:yes stop_codon:yes gene_type:complete